MKNRQARKISVLLVFLWIVFSSPQKAEAAASSQCTGGQSGGAQTGCSHTQDASILQNQCLAEYAGSPGACADMNSYLKEMQADCQMVKPAGIDCSLITEGSFYGREAAKFANFLEGNGVGSGGGSGNASGELDFPDEFNLPDHPGGVRGLVATFLNWLLMVVAILAMMAFVISGLQYFLASGDENKMTIAKRNWTYSILGVIAALAGFIVVRAVDSALNASSVLF